MSETATPTKPLTTEEQATVLKHGERVMRLSQQIFDSLVVDTEDLPGPERWMVISRVVSGVFAHHFSIALNVAGSEMAKRSKTASSNPPESIL